MRERTYQLEERRHFEIGDVVMLPREEPLRQEFATSTVRGGVKPLPQRQDRVGAVQMLGDPGLPPEQHDRSDRHPPGGAGGDEVDIDRHEALEVLHSRLTITRWTRDRSGGRVRLRPYSRAGGRNGADQSPSSATYFLSPTKP